MCERKLYFYYKETMLVCAESRISGNEFLDTVLIIKIDNCKDYISHLVTASTLKSVVTTN